MSEFLFVLWAGGGNVPPQLVLARRLAARGDSVRVLAPAALRRRIEEAGLLYEPYRSAPEHDESLPEQSLIRDFEHRLPVRAAAAVRERLLVGMAQPIAADALDVLDRRPADAIAFDYMLFGALFAAEKRGLPAAMLVHNVYPFPSAGRPPFTMGWMPMSGPLGRLRDAAGWSMFRQVYERPLIPALNAVRSGLGLRPVASLADLLSRPQRILVLTSPSFDLPGPLPPNASYVGAQLEDPAWSAEWQSPWSPADDRPLVVVGLTTTFQAHQALLERII
jgi:UDP:flavonoid glycosyltransferase YjiC (YdhE family)